MNKLHHDGSASPEKGRPKYKHPRDTFHAFMVDGAELDPDYDMPLLRDDRFVPTALVPFSVAKRADWTNFDCAVHFCERDQDIEPFWNNPGRYIPKLMKFQGVIGLDYSTCVDFPLPLKEWNIYRNRACDFKLQDSGIGTISPAEASCIFRSSRRNAWSRSMLEAVDGGSRTGRPLISARTSEPGCRPMAKTGFPRVAVLSITARPDVILSLPVPPKRIRYGPQRKKRCRYYLDREV